MRIFKESMLLTTNLIDIHKEFHLYAMINLLQDLAARHADDLGFGWNFMNANNWFWVLIRLRIDILQHPKWKEKLIVETWPKEHDMISSYRDFVFTDLEGNELIRASTAWIVLDRETRRPIRMSTVFSQQRPLVRRDAINEPLNKILIPKEKFLLRKLKVLYTDLDMNLHMNNANYVRKILDAYELDFLQKHHAKQLILNFLKETVYGQTLNVYLHNSLQEKIHYLSLETQGQTCLFAQIKWEKIQK